MRQARHRVQRGVGLGLTALALLFAGSTARAQQANYPLPQQPTAQSGTTFYYAVPIGYTWDHFAYQNGNHGDWNVGLGDSGFDAGEIPSNPQNCGVRGEMCPATAGAEGPAFIHLNNDPTHGFTNIPMLIGPTQDGFNNVQIARGQSIPVVPGRYTGLYLSNTQINGPRRKVLTLNYTDSSEVRILTWADWCAPNQSPPDFFTWAPTHRLNQASNPTPTNSASCALITKFVPVDPNRALVSVTLGTDSPDDSGGIALPGQTIVGANGRTVIGGLTLASTDANLGSYGFVSGRVLNASGEVQTTPVHESAAAPGFDVFVIDPPLGNYGAGANVDGTYTIGLPAGTYTLSAAVRGGIDDPASYGPQATPVTVTIEAGKTTVQDVTLLANPDTNLWGDLQGTVTDAAGNPVEGAAILMSNSQTGPFSAVNISQDRNFTNGGVGSTTEDGTFFFQGLYTGKPIYLMAAGNGFATAAPVMVNLTPGGTATQDLQVVARPVGNIRGTVQAPGGTFGGIGVPVVLSSRDLTLTTTTRADPALTGTGRVTDQTAIFEFNSLPAGDYTLTLPASALQGAEASMPVTVTAGQTAAPTLTLAFPAWSEGTADATKSDPLTGAALDARWTAMDIGAPAEAGSVQAGADGLTVTADGVGWDVRRDDDAYHYVHQQIPAGDWVAYVTVTKAPTAGFSVSGGEFISPGGMAGLMVSSKADARAANFVISVTNPENAEGIVAQGRLADGTTTFPYGQTAAGTSELEGGTQPPLPIVLKIRKVGGSFAGFYSADGGATQHFIGHLTPQFAPGAPVLVGLATTTNEEGTLDTATYRDFVFAPLAAAPPAAGQ